MKIRRDKDTQGKGYILAGDLYRVCHQLGFAQQVLRSKTGLGVDKSRGRGGLNSHPADQAEPDCSNETGGLDGHLRLLRRICAFQVQVRMVQNLLEPVYSTPSLAREKAQYR